MKKRLVVAFACLLALSCALPAAAEEASIVGDWTLTRIESGAVVVDAAEAGVDLAVTFAEDGSVSMEMSGVIQSGTWSFENGVVSLLADATGMVLEFALAEDGTLHYEEDGAVIVMERGAAGQAEGAAVLEDVALADFNGDWTAVRASAKGAEIDLEAYGLEMEASIADGSVTIVSNGASQTIEADLEGNALILDAGAAQMPLYLYEDGTLCMAFSEELVGMPLEVIFEPADQ